LSAINLCVVRNLQNSPMNGKFLHIALLTFILIESCTSTDKPFIISSHDRTKELNRSHNFFYSRFNIIISPSGILFFHNRDSLLNCCDTGEDYNFPDYVGLKPEDLIVYKDTNLSKLVDSISKLPTDDNHSLQIASFSDSLNSKPFFNILKLLKQKNVENYDVRLVTEEEREVVNAKINDVPYDFYRINWKSRFSNTVFPPPFKSSAK